MPLIAKLNIEMNKQFTIKILFKMINEIITHEQANLCAEGFDVLAFHLVWVSLPNSVTHLLQSSKFLTLGRTTAALREISSTSLINEGLSFAFEIADIFS